MTIYSIYRATNTVNGKVYIGYTSDFDHRVIKHKSQSKTRDTLFCRAIRKYGWDKFTWDIIYQSKDSEHCLHVMEPHFIKEYSAEYNMNEGGHGATDLHEDTRRRISKSIRALHDDPNSVYKSEECLRKKSIAGKAAWLLVDQTTRNTKMANSLKKRYTITDPTGNKHDVLGLKDFCLEHSLHAGTMVQVAKGIHKAHKGWTCTYS